MAHVQTVLGRIEPASLGFTLPHEHTQIALWHIEGRWDYWQLTRDEPVILDELARFRAAGGSALVDLTQSGVGRDPEWLVRLAKASGLHLVMGCGWYRTAYYPPEARIDRRSVDELADELIREFEDGVGESGVRRGQGFVYFAESFLPRLREAGVSAAEIETMTVLNPRRLLTIG